MKKTVVILQSIKSHGKVLPCRGMILSIGLVNLISRNDCLTCLQSLDILYTE